MEQVFRHMNAAYMSLESRLKAEGFKLRVLQVFKAWEEWAVYQRDFLTKLKHIFLGIPSVSMNSSILKIIPDLFRVSYFYSLMFSQQIFQAQEKPLDIDGAPISGDEKEDEDLDGIPLDGAALRKSAMMRGIPGASGTASTQSPSRSSEQHLNIQQTDHSQDDSDYDDDIDGVPSEWLYFRYFFSICTY